MKRLVVIFAVYLFGMASGGAQTPPAAATPVVIRFSVFGIERFSDLHFQPLAGGAPQKLKFNTSQRSEVYRYEGPLPLVFFKPALDGAAPTPVASIAAAPADGGRILVLFFRDSSAGGGIRAISFPDDAKTLPARHVNILNATGASLLARIGSEQITLNRGLSAAYLAPPPTSPIQVAMRVGERTPIVNTTPVSLEGGARATLVLFPPKSRDLPLLPSRLLVEEPERNPAEAKGAGVSASSTTGALR
jgi:hypothetical protein